MHTQELYIVVYVKNIKSETAIALQKITNILIY